MRVTKFEFQAFESVQGGAASPDPYGWDAEMMLRDFGQADIPHHPTANEASIGEADTDSPPEATEAAPPPAVVITEEMLLTARQEGYQQGFNDGRTEGLEEGRNKGHAEGLAEGVQLANEREQAAVAQHEKHLAQSLKQLTTQFATLFGDVERQQAEAPAALARMAFAIARKIVGYELQADAGRTISHYLTESLAQLAEWNRVTVEVAPSLLAGLTPQLDGIRQQAAFRGQIDLQANPALQPGDCRVNWQSGSAERLIGEMTDRIAGLM